MTQLAHLAKPVASLPAFCDPHAVRRTRTAQAAAARFCGRRRAAARRRRRRAVLRLRRATSRGTAHRRGFERTAQAARGVPAPHGHGGGLRPVLEAARVITRARSADPPTTRVQPIEHPARAPATSRTAGSATPPERAREPRVVAAPIPSPAGAVLAARVAGVRHLARAGAGSDPTVTLDVEVTAGRRGERPRRGPRRAAPPAPCAAHRASVRRRRAPPRPSAATIEHDAASADRPRTPYRRLVQPSSTSRARRTPRRRPRRIALHAST